MRKISAVVMSMLLAACSGGDGEAGSSAQGADGAGAAGSATRAGGETVAAVLQTPGTALAAVRYQVGGRPVVGQPFPVTLSISAAQAVPVLNVRLESRELEVSPAAAQLVLSGGDEAATLELTVTARQPGLAELVARLSVGGATESLHAIPVLVPAPQEAP